MLAAGGMQEVINYSVASMDLIERAVPVDSDAPPMRLANPMSATHEYLRPTLQAGLLANLAVNQAQGPGPFRLFEAGRVFLPRSGDLPEEVEIVASVLAGRRGEASWHDATDGGGMDFYDAKGMGGMAAGAAGHPRRVGAGGSIQSTSRAGVQWSGSGGAGTGICGRDSPGDKGAFSGWTSERLRVLSCGYRALLAALPESERHFASLPRFPAATRDLALIVPADVPAGRVTELIMRNRLVQRAELFDIYSGENLEPGTKSLAFHVHFQAADPDADQRRGQPLPGGPVAQSGTGSWGYSAGLGVPLSLSVEGEGWGWGVGVKSQVSATLTYGGRLTMTTQHRHQHGHHEEAPHHHGHSHADEDMLSVEEAYERVMASFAPLEGVEVPLLESPGADAGRRHHFAAGPAAAGELRHGRLRPARRGHCGGGGGPRQPGCRSSASWPPGRCRSGPSSPARPCG